MTKNALFIALVMGCLISNNSWANQKQTYSKDGEIINFVMAIDKHEVDAAKVALAKKPRPEIVNYADEMINDHGKNLEEMENLSSSENILLPDTEAIQNFKAKGEKGLTDLRKSNGNTINSKYINAMVSGHKEALAKLDDFIRKAYNKHLKDELISTREAVKAHLTKAKELQAQING